MKFNWLSVISLTLSSVLEQSPAGSQLPLQDANSVKKFANHFQVTWEYAEDPKNFPGYTVRVKETDPEVLAIDSVKQYAGYLDIEEDDKHFFYWFFESRNDPINDPVILWLNGGPGCSSMTGLFFELGPSRINSDLKPEFNPYSWNNNASVIFLDQPVGVGYSYSSSSSPAGKVKSTEAAAKDVYAFLELFYQKFPHLQQNAFHIAGESYAGHYIPKFASEIISHRKTSSFQLTSVLIGNGITNAKIQHGSFKPMACGQGGVPQIISDEECEKMDEMYPKCVLLIEVCEEFPSALTCQTASNYCTQMLDPVLQTDYNPYDLRFKCDQNSTGCYEQEDWFTEYLNQPEVMQALGVEVDHYQNCNSEILHDFYEDGDRVKRFDTYITELLEYRIPVLIYAGDKDFRCNWIGNHMWTDSLSWHGHEAFKKELLKPWYNPYQEDSKPAGEVKSFGNFTYLRIYDAGHMVPFNQPENSLAMVNIWINGGYELTI